jgi:hypothetical protein
MMCTVALGLNSNNPWGLHLKRREEEAPALADDSLAMASTAHLSGSH